MFDLSQLSDQQRLDLVGGLYAACMEASPDWDGSFPDSEEKVRALVGASREQAREAPHHLRVIFSVFRALREEAMTEVCAAVRDYLLDHPGAVRMVGGRHLCSDGFRRFVVGLVEPGEAGSPLSSADFAEAVGFPLETVEVWLKAARPGKP